MELYWKRMHLLHFVQHLLFHVFESNHIFITLGLHLPENKVKYVLDENYGFELVGKLYTLLLAFLFVFKYSGSGNNKMIVCEFGIFRSL